MTLVVTLLLLLVSALRPEAEAVGRRVEEKQGAQKITAKNFHLSKLWLGDCPGKINLKGNEILVSAHTKMLVSISGGSTRSPHPL